MFASKSNRSGNKTLAKGKSHRTVVTSKDVVKKSARHYGGPGYHHMVAPAITLSRPVQTKVTVGKAGDRYEREADAVADKVTGGVDAGEISRIPPGGLKAQTKSADEGGEHAQTNFLQRNAAETERAQQQTSSENSDSAQMQAEGSDDQAVQEKCASCESEQQSREPNRSDHEKSADSHIVQRDGEETEAEDPPFVDEESEGGEDDPDAADCGVGNTDTEADTDDIAAEETESAEEPDSAEPGAAAESSGAEAEGEELGCGAESEGESEDGAASPAAGGEQSCGSDAAAGEGEEAEPVEGAEAGSETGETEAINPDPAPPCSDEVEAAAETPEETAAEGEQPAGGGEQGECAAAQSMSDESAQETSVQREAEEPAQEASDGDVQEKSDDEDSAQEASDNEAQESAVQLEDESAAQEACGDETAQELTLQREEEAAETQGDEGETQLDAAESGGCAEAESEVTAQTKAGNEVERQQQKSTIASQAIQNRDSGEPLLPSVQAKLESSLGMDLSSVRVHTGSAALEANRGLKARAFTHKNHIWLGPGQSQSNVRLMAHEVTHTVQQGAVAPKSGETSPGSADKSGANKTSDGSTTDNANSAPGKEVENSEIQTSTESSTAQFDSAIDYTETPFPTEEQTKAFKSFDLAKSQLENLKQAVDQIVYLIFEREENAKKRETKALIERTIKYVWRDFKDYVIDSGGINGLLPVQKTFIKTESGKISRVKTNIAKIKTAASGDKREEYSLREQALAVMQRWIANPYFIYYALNFGIGLNWNVHGNPAVPFDKEEIEKLRQDLKSKVGGETRAKTLMRNFFYEFIVEEVNKQHGDLTIDLLWDLLKVDSDDEESDEKGGGEGGDGEAKEAKLPGEYSKKRLKSLTKKQKRLLKRLPREIRKSKDTDALVNLLDKLLAMSREDQDKFIKELHQKAKLNKDKEKGKKGANRAGGAKTDRESADKKPKEIDVDAVEDEITAREDIDEVLRDEQDQDPVDQVDEADKKASKDNELSKFLKTLSAEERKAFIEFLNSLKQSDKKTDLKTPDEIFNAFKQLTPADKEALKLKKMLADLDVDQDQQLDAEKQKKIRVAVQKAKADAEQAEVDAKSINSDMEIIRNLLADGDAKKSLVPLDTDDFKVLPERMMLYGLMDGAGTKSTEIREAASGLKAQIGNIQSDLLKQIRDIAIEMGIHVGLTAIPIVGWLKVPWTVARLAYLGHKINKIRKKLLALKRGYETFQNIRTTIENARSIINSAPGYVKKFENARRNWEALRKQLDNLDSTDDIEERIELAFDQLMEQFNDKIDVLEPFFDKMYLPDDVREDPQKLIEILFNMPKGIETFGDMISTYKKNPSTSDTDELLVLYYKGMQSGALLYPLVGFVIGALSKALKKAFTSRFSGAGALNRFLGRRKKWGKRGKGGKTKTGGRLGSLWPKKMEYKGHNKKLGKTPQFDSHLRAGGKLLEDEIKAGKPPWKFRLRLYLRFWLRGFVKRLNKKGWTVQGRRKAKKKKKEDYHSVPLPKFKYRLKRSSGKHLIVLRINPDYKKTIAKLDYAYMKKKGLPLPSDFRSEEARSLKKWLEKNGYELTELKAIGWHIRRVKGKSVKKEPLRIKNKKIIAGLESTDSGALNVFIAANQTIVNNVQLPDGFHLSKSSIPSTRSRKIEKHILRRSPRTSPAFAMYLDGEGKLKQGKSSGKEEVVLANPAGAIKGPVPDSEGRPHKADGLVGYTVNKNRGSLSAIKVPGMRKKDDKGHVIAARFNGADKAHNLVAMNRKLNQSGDWYKEESAFAKAYIKAIGEAAMLGQKAVAKVNIVVHYLIGKKSRRPSKFDFTWWVKKNDKQVDTGSLKGADNK